jgi:hypothetical protein
MADDHEPSFAELAARVLRDAERPTVQADAGDREAHLVVMAAALRNERARVSRRRWTGAALALAAVLVAAVGLRGVLRGKEAVPTMQPLAASPYGLRVEGSGAEVARSAASAAGAIHAGDRVSAKGGVVAVVVATGTKLTLDQGADVSVVEEGRAQIFALGAGNVRADVAKLHEGERFVVRTSDTEVEVRGTSFRIERVDIASSCRPNLHTRVIVTEGVVVVRHAGAEDRVKAGEQWPSPCAPVPTDSGALPSAARPQAPNVASSAASSPPGAPSPSSGSKLGASNELFASAEAARKSGDARGALALFDKFLAEYPSSPIVESATVERMRTLDQVDRGRAVAAAREYLARFPHGFARGEAEAIVALGP